MLSLQMNTDQWTLFLDDVKAYFDKYTLNKGFDYFRQGRITSIYASEPRELEATVQGTSKYKVSFNFDFFTLSGCSCPVEGFCKHMAAVVFAIGVQKGFSAKSFLLLLESEIGSQQPVLSLVTKGLVKDGSGSNLFVSSAKQKVPAIIKIPQIAEVSIEAWHQYFEEVMHKHVLSEYTIDTFLNDAIQQLTRHNQTLSPELEALYHANMILYVLKRTEDYYISRKYALYYYEHAFNRFNLTCLKQLLEVYKSISADALLTSEVTKLEDTRKLIGELAFTEQPSPIQWWHVYQMGWNHWFLVQEWFEQELERLRTEQERHATEAYIRDRYAAAYAFHYVMIGQDEQAMQILTPLTHSNEASHVFPYIQMHMDGRNWQKMKAWLIWMGPHAFKGWREELEQYSNYWKVLIEHVVTEEESYLKAMRSLLPRSYDLYATYLYDKQKHFEWIDLQLFMDIHPLSHRAADLQQVEKVEPYALLPYYHQFIEKSIQMKNRPAYKDAVKMLKRLSKVYKKTKQADVWEHYLDHLSIKHSRLRALQEELRKGKLLS